MTPKEAAALLTIASAYDNRRRRGRPARDLPTPDRTRIVTESPLEQTAEIDAPLCSCSVARVGDVHEYETEVVHHVRYPADCYATTRVTPPGQGAS